MTVRLTFPAREPGACRIMAGKLQVGHALADHRMMWTAWLWRAPGRPGEGFAGEIRGADLRNLRDQVAGRLAEDGPWWSEAAGTDG